MESDFATKSSNTNLPFFQTNSAPLPAGIELREKTPIEFAKPSSGQLRLQNALPVRIGKGSSKISVSSSKRSRSKPQEFIHSPVASFAEISRLSSLNDEQRRTIAALKDEIKTLKIVITRQEKGLSALDREQAGYPKLFERMNEDLRIARAEQRRCLDKVSLLEKQAVSKAEEFYKLQMQNKEMKLKIKDLENPDVTSLNNQLKEKQQEVEDLAIRLESAIASLKTVKAEKAKETFLLKQKNLKLSAELEASKRSVVALPRSKVEEKALKVKKGTIVRGKASKIDKDKVPKRTVKSVVFKKDIATTPKSHSRAATPELYQVFDEGKSIQDYEELEQDYEESEDLMDQEKLLDLEAPDADSSSETKKELEIGLRFLSPVPAEVEIPTPSHKVVKAEVVISEGSIFKPQINKTIVIATGKESADSLYSEDFE